MDLSIFDNYFEYNGFNPFFYSIFYVLFYITCYFLKNNDQICLFPTKFYLTSPAPIQSEFKGRCITDQTIAYAFPSYGMAVVKPTLLWSSFIFKD